MSILLVCPDPDKTPSGGNRYNAALLRAARRAARPILRCTPAREGVLPHTEFTSARLAVVDSLYWPHIARWSLDVAIPTCVLVHYLPSDDPALPPESAAALEDIEREALAHAVGAILTGPGPIDTLSRVAPRLNWRECVPGVDERFSWRARRASATRDPPQILSVGNIRPAKGYLEMFQALARLSHLRWTWSIIGDDAMDPAYVERLRTIVRQAGLADRVGLLSVKSWSEVAAALHRADLFVHFSRYEAYGMALAEALACGVPSVSTAVGAAERLIHDGRNGYIVPVGDVAALQGRLEALLRGARLREQFSHATRVAAPPTWDDTRRRFESACDALLAASRIPHSAR